MDAVLHDWPEDDDEPFWMSVFEAYATSYPRAGRLMLALIRGRGTDDMAAGLESRFRVLYHALMHTGHHVKGAVDDTPTRSRPRVPTHPSIWLSSAKVIEELIESEEEEPGRVSRVEEC